jgi:predicted small lipoprotein YifL
MRRALATLVALAVLAATAASCLSPTLPLPPPDQPDTIVASSDNLWEISGECVAGALVTVFNARTNRGVVVEDATDSGSYAVALPGLACDPVWVQQSNSNGESSATSFVLQAYQDGSPVDPNACP